MTGSTTPTQRNQVASRLSAFGETIFAEMSRLALKHNAINLGQGFPNFNGPDFIIDAAVDAMRAGENQYARSFGIPALTERIARNFGRASGLAVDPDAEVTVTSGCTEALAASFLGLINPGDEVILIEPYYDSYRACAALAGATVKYVSLRAPEFRLPADELRAAFSSATRAIVVNTPHNPTGRVFNEGELALIAELCQEHDALALTDEVYEHLVFEGEHIHLATLDGMRERTVTMSSLGKTFSLTGWKIGWAIAPAELTRGVRMAHQFLTFCSAAPLQHGAVAALDAPQSYYQQYRDQYRQRRDVLVEGLARVGFDVRPPEGTYFVLADHTPFGYPDDVAFCRHLIEDIGVAAIPPSAFYEQSNDGASLVRFAFCKDVELIRSAVQRLGALKG